MLFHKICKPILYTLSVNEMRLEELNIVSITKLFYHKYKFMLVLG